MMVQPGLDSMADVFYLFLLVIIAINSTSPFQVSGGVYPIVLSLGVYGSASVCSKAQDHMRGHSIIPHTPLQVL